MDSTLKRTKSSFGSTLRDDKWWLEPLLVFSGLGAFIIYSTWAAFQAEHYFAVSYLSPMYSPPLFIDSSATGAAPMFHSWFGEWPAWWPAFLPASPAFLILVFPLSFRFTCYYYRGAYYKAFAGTPPACAVGGVPRKKYMGETALMIFQNLHRYALYFALIFLVFLTYDAILAYSHEGQLGIGVGSIVLTLNPIFLGLYTLGCHSFRHLIGGKHDCFSCARGGLRHGTFQKVSWLNHRHKMFAWISLFWVGFTDLYVRMVSMGIWTDFNTWGV